MITSQEWVDRLQTLASWNSRYRNEYPYNLLYWDGVRYWADCVNLLKALFNGRDIYNKTVGSFQRDLSLTGDITELQMINACEGVSSDFRTLGSEPEVLYMSGHIGTYLGKEVVVDGTIRNVIECTPSWENGIIYSYVDSYGGRSHHKGASSSKAWSHHGKPTRWVKYTSQTFTDVTPSMSSYKAIEWAAKQGIVVGYNDGTFRPSNNCTRAQFVTMLWRYAGRPEVSVEVRFNDVNKGMSAYKAIAWAYSTGIIVGYRDGTFRPNKNLTRAQIVTMLWRFNGRPFAESGKTFKDVTASMSAYRAIMWATAKGVVMGYSDGTFRPSNNCTRQQLAVILWRMAGRP